MDSSGKKNITHLYNLYVDDLFTYALYLGFDKEEAMDAVHDVFLKFSLKGDNTFDSIENIKFYLFKSLKNKLLDTYNAKKKYINLATAEVNYEIPFNINVTIEDNIVDIEDQQTIRIRINEMLETLTARQREIVYLRYIQGYDFQEISQILNISIHGCRKLVSKAILSLRNKFGVSIVLLLLSL